MIELIKILNLGKLSKAYKTIIVIAVFILLVLETPLLQNFLEKPSDPTLTITNIGFENKGEISNNGVDSRSATTNIVGNNNNVISNSVSDANK